MVSGKALCNVSTTSHHNPDAVLNELTRALMFKVRRVVERIISINACVLHLVVHSVTQSLLKCVQHLTYPCFDPHQGAYV